MAVKELERSLVARMFRAGVIDAATFITRVTALGYSMDDTLLMLKLEKKEAAKVLLWQGIPQPTGVSPAESKVYDAYSPNLDIATASYFFFTVDVGGLGQRFFSFAFEQYDSVGDKVAGVVKVGEAGKSIYTWSESKHMDAVTGKLRVTCDNTTGVFGVINFSTCKVEMVVA